MRFGTNCSALGNNFTSYGLIVGGESHISNVHVHGSVYVRSDTDLTQINELESGCGIYTDQGSGYLNFDQVNTNFLYASQKLSFLEPTLYLDANNKLTRIADNSLGYDVITFNTCTGGCNTTAKLSVPDAIFNFIGNWNGPEGMSWPKKLIVNVSRAWRWDGI